LGEREEGEGREEKRKEKEEFGTRLVNYC